MDSRDVGKKPSFIDFRSRALSGLTLVPADQRVIMSKDEREAWVRREYERHWGPVDIDIQEES